MNPKNRTDNVVKLRMSSAYGKFGTPKPAHTKKLDPLLLFIIPIGFIAVGLMAAIVWGVMRPEPQWRCTDADRVEVARFFQACIKMNPGAYSVKRKACMEDARTLYCKKVP